MKVLDSAVVIVVVRVALGPRRPGLPLTVPVADALHRVFPQLLPMSASGAARGWLLPASCSPPPLTFSPACLSTGRRHHQHRTRHP